jgi:hypothetical protein
MAVVRRQAKSLPQSVPIGIARELAGLGHHDSEREIAEAPHALDPRPDRQLVSELAHRLLDIGTCLDEWLASLPVGFQVGRHSCHDGRIIGFWLFAIIERGHDRLGAGVDFVPLGFRRVIAPP